MARVRKASVVLRLALYGCPNRPFFHIVAGKRKAARNRYIYEQLGVYDPMPNEHNENIVSLNIDRIKYWLAHGAEPKKSVAVLLGLAGILPVHPYSLEVARRNKELSHSTTTATTTAATDILEDIADKDITEENMAQVLSTDNKNGNSNKND